jgi:dipeptidyl aminopeptidase/acylaminoacyl peptidase
LCSIAIAFTILLPSLVHSRSLTIEDVLAIQTVDGASVSPGAADIAIAMPRPAGKGEVYGRNAYEIDPSRNDIWLVRRDGSQLRRLTDGKPNAAGYWCPHWSPDGKRLALLSTAPEGREPRGGDSARLYVWERGPVNPRRVSDRALMTQTRYGGPLNELDLRAAGEGEAKTCRSNDENAPFVWLDETRLLAMLMPEGQRSALVERYAKFHREVARAGEDIRAGEIATVSRSDTRSEGSVAYEAELVIFDLEEGSQTSLGKVPAFPMFGKLTIAISPDGARAAVLAPRRAIPQHLIAEPRLNFGTWEVEKALFVANLKGVPRLAPITHASGPLYPVDFLHWSPASNRFALRARSDTTRNEASLWAVDAETGASLALTPGEVAGSLHQQGPGEYAFWLDDTIMLAYASAPNAEGRWRRVDASNGETLAPLEPQGVTELTQLADGTLAGRNDDGVVRYDAASARFSAWQAIPVGACRARPTRITDSTDEGVTHTLWTSAGPLASSATLSGGTRILDHDCTGLVIAEKDGSGSRIRFIPWDAEPVLLMERNAHLAEVTRGERRMIDYIHADGSAQKMAVMFPPDYDPEKRYPTLFWVYGRYSPRGFNDFFFDPHTPGLYNLDLYTGQGYVVVVPSIPIAGGEVPSELFSAIPGGVLPALDELIRLGITDEARVGVLGQSFGGYTVNALVAQTDRFAAAISLAGATDLAANAAAFDPSARGWRGLGHDMAFNQGIYETAFNLRVDAGTDPALYHRNSPLTYANQINTPLLLIHGELDSRAPLTQVETLYSLLRRRGRPARLLRYWGENHSLANSPANVRDLTDEVLTWFNTYLLANESPIE